MGDAMNGLIAELRSIVGNEGGFLHKSFIGRAVGGAVKGFITGGPTGALAGGIRSFTGGPTVTTARPTVPRTTTARVTSSSISQRQFATSLKFPNGGPPGVTSGRFPGITIPGGNGNGCEPPLRRGPRGNCIFPGSPVGADVFGGESIIGMHGAGMVAGSRIVDVATCLRGMHLGNDGVCYKKGAITNKERMWPAGAKPLLTGGEMNAIRTADTARGRVARAAGRLGIVPKAPRRRKTPAGHKAKLAHA